MRSSYGNSKTVSIGKKKRNRGALFCLTKLRLKLFIECNDRVGIDLPTIEVRFDHLKVEAEVHVGGRALPTFVNFMSNFVDVIMPLFFLLLYIFKH